MSESFSAAFKVYWPVVILCFVLVLVQLDFQASFFSQLEWKPVSYSTKTTNTPIYREQAWCPSAPISSCGFVHDHCDPCGRRWLIIVSMGRAASTTLMNQMWTLPQIHMGGENSGLFFNLNKAFNQTLTAKSFNETDRVAAWAHEPVSKELLSCSIQNALEAINPPQNPQENPILGFKTIRLKASNTKKLKQIAHFLQESFPCAKFLINYRSAEKIKASRDVYFAKERPIDEIQKQLERLIKFGSFLPESQTRVLNSDEWTEDVSILNEVVDWMGYSKECHFTEVLQFNTDEGYGNGITELKVDPKCRYLG